MKSPRICPRCAATAFGQPALNSLPQWPRGMTVAYAIGVDLNVGGASADQVDGLIDDAILTWAKVCGIAFRRVSDPSQANLWVRSQPIDGPYNILGQTELPVDGRPGVRHTMTLDSTEPWSALELHECCIHESGHGIGLEHSPAGIVAIMAPVLNLRVTAPQPWDISQAQARYGPPAAAPAPQPAAPPPAPPRWKAVPRPDGSILADFGPGDWLGTDRTVKLEFRPAPAQAVDDFSYGYATIAGATDWTLGVGQVDSHWYMALLELGDPIA